MMRQYFRILFFCIAFLLVGFPGSGLSQSTDATARHILRIIEASQKNRAFVCRKERICGISAIPAFYQKREYAPAWTREGTPTLAVQDLLRALDASVLEGLSPEIYHLSEITTLLRKANLSQTEAEVLNPSMLAELDILLTDAFLLYAAHLRAGRVDPETIHTAWAAFLPEVDLGRVLSDALRSGRIMESLATLIPPAEGYRRLKEALAHYRTIAAAGPWPRIGPGPTLRHGDTDGRIPALKQLLEITGDLKGSADPESLQLDAPLEEALRRFQARHGIEVDGILGRQTLNALHVPPSERLRQMELNLERWRWLPHDLGKRHILVNIAAFRLNVVEAERSVLDMRVVVGTDYRKSPVFSETMKYVVLNPFWNVPFRIVVKDKLPLIRKDPGYLSTNGYRVFAGWEEHAEEVMPESIDWNGIDRSNFVYRLRQDPGPKNALGRIKFMFPNRFSVYLHDTPQQEFFQKTVRTFSSGCIRIQKPLELAVYVLGGTGWDRERIEKAIDSGKNRVILLKNTLPVHLLYWTAWMEPDGTLQFREDIYDRDLLLDRALKERPPGVTLSAGGNYQ